MFQCLNFFGVLFALIFSSLTAPINCCLYVYTSLVVTCPFAALFAITIRMLRNTVMKRLWVFYMFSFNLGYFFLLNSVCCMYTLTFTVVGLVLNPVELQQYILYAILVAFYILNFYSLYTAKYLNLKLNLIKICKELHQSRVYDAEEADMRQTLGITMNTLYPELQRNFLTSFARILCQKAKVPL